jgi:WD40 repeat protein
VFTSSLLSKSIAALCLSGAAFAGCVALQAAIFVCHDRSEMDPPDSITVRRVVLTNEGRTALVLHSDHHLQDLFENASHVASIWDVSTREPRFQTQLPQEAIWQIASAPASSYAFVATEAGDLYWLDLATSELALHRLGSFPAGHGRLMECADDGSVVIVAGEDLTAWDRDSAQLSWRRTDVSVTAVSFLPRSHRVLCGLETGEVIEIDPVTGDTLREVARHRSPVMSIAVSPDARLFASAGTYDECQVTELATGRRVWSHPCVTLAVARFSPDGRLLLLSGAEKEASMTLFSLSSGEPIARLCGRKGAIKEVTVAGDGTTYVCGAEPTITVWNMAAGSVTACFNPKTCKQN